MAGSGVGIAAVVLMGLAAAAVYDLQRVQRETLVVYTTPALRELLEKDTIPRFEAAGHTQVHLIYTNAGQQYSRLRLSGDEPEAHVFLHASPLYLEKGNADGYFQPFNLSEEERIDPLFKSVDPGTGRYWYAFAWSPLVEVFDPSFETPPDIGLETHRFGLPHPKLSNNGVYNSLVLEAVDAGVGPHVLDQTVVQPVNSRATIAGVADGSFAVTLGYEAVTRFFLDQGAKVEYGPVTVHGEHVTTPVLFSAAAVKGDHNEDAQRLIRFLFETATQSSLKKFHFLPTVGTLLNETHPIQGTESRLLHHDWTKWKMLDEALGNYEVKSGGYA